MIRIRHSTSVQRSISNFTSTHPPHKTKVTGPTPAHSALPEGKPKPAAYNQPDSHSAPAFFTKESDAPCHSNERLVRIRPRSKSSTSGSQPLTTAPRLRSEARCYLCFHCSQNFVNPTRSGASRLYVTFGFWRRTIGVPLGSFASQHSRTTSTASATGTPKRMTLTPMLWPTTWHPTCRQLVSTSLEE